MDYTEMLFAYQVRKEAMQQFVEEFPRGLSSVEGDIEYLRIVRRIVGSTEHTAKMIRSVA